jgi:sporulation protein YlmC with PRC-barrel domain
MAPPQNALNWEGQTLLDRDGDKIGKIEEIFLVEETGRPEWALVKLGRLKSHTTLVPLTSAQPVDDGVEVPFKKDVVNDAPPIEADAEPSETQVEAVYGHYGIALPDEQSSSSDVSPAATPQRAPETSNGSSSNGQGHGDLRDQPVADVVKTVSDEAKTLLGQEAKLAKAEMSGKVKDVGIGAGMFGGAGYVANLAAIALMLTLIFALATAMQAWLAALIVTVVFAAVAGALALMGKKRIQNAGPPVPEQTIESIKETVQTVKEEAKWGLGQTTR